MKKFKRIDFWISCILITMFLVLSLIKMDETFIIGYFVVGGWQVISMIIHAVNNWFTQKGGARHSYHWTVFWLFILTGTCFFIPVIILFILFPMLFAAPFMALYYTWLCYNEVYVKMKRPIEILK